jgi:hypothetical protein
LTEGASALGGRAGPRTGNCDINFVLEGGPGVLIFMSQHAALDIGYRVHHISNGHQCLNQGFNSNMGVIGLSYFFRSRGPPAHTDLIDQFVWARPG